MADVFKIEAGGSPRMKRLHSCRLAALNPVWGLILLLAAVSFLATCGEKVPGPSPTLTPTATLTPTPTLAPSPSPSLPDEQALAIALRFDAQDALDVVKTLADPSFMGRHVGTPGELKGAQFLADAFQEAGLEPGGDDGSYLQSFFLEVQEMAATPALELAGPGGETQALRFRDDFRPIFGGSAGAGDVQGPGLFVGTGANLSGLDVAGKVLLAVPRGSLSDLVARAREAGALAVIVTTGQAVLIKGEGRPPDPGAIPVAALSQSGAAALLEGSGHSREELNADIEAGRPLPTFSLAWTVRLAVFLQPPAQVEARNVIGVLPGASDTERTIVVGAHYEEIGPDPDGVVYPAANDNASGTAVLVELARLFQEVGFQPEANLVFIAWSGHEEGLFGSSFYVDNPRLPLSQTTLYLNIDTVGQGGAPNLEAVSSHSSARSLLDRALDLLRGQGEPAPVRVADSPEGLSDDRNFVSAGVPSLSLAWGGLFEDGPHIHTPQDTADTVDPFKLELSGRLSALVVILAAR